LINNQKNTIIIIAGPTAVGKTNIAIELAKHLRTSIISADSRQCFKELDIGVAKPSPAQLAAVKHYFINTHSINDEVTAATFEQYALEAAQAIFQRSPVAVMAGGTGLYIKAFCEGLDEMPAIPAPVRHQIIAAYEEKGIAFLQEELKQKDPLFWQTAEQQNPQRLMRALEVLYATGRSIATYRNNTPVKRPFNIIKIGMELPREVLYGQINYRVDEMIKVGLIEEVKSLLPYQHLNALQTVGYKELFDYFSNSISLQKAIESIKQNTRHYAKRQMTWFKKDTQFKWFAPGNCDAIVEYIENILQE
jgi:tRNA dimethylallyltransferase